MPVIAKGNNNEPTPPGMHQAVCAFVVDIGTQEGSYMGEKTFNKQVVVFWELATKMKEGDNSGKPFLYSKFYTNSLDKKANLRKDLVAWRGKDFTTEELKGFDLEKLIGVNCQLNLIEEEGKSYLKMSAIMPVAANTDMLKIFNDKPPKWVVEKKSKSVEYKTNNPDDNIDDLGF